MAPLNVFGRILRRNYVTDMSFVPGYHKLKNPEQSVRMWKFLAFFVGTPSIVIAAINAYLIEKEVEETFERPEYVDYDYINNITKPFPWGNGRQGLFFNPSRNVIKGVGYLEPWPKHH